MYIFFYSQKGLNYYKFLIHKKLLVHKEIFETTLIALYSVQLID